MLSLKSFTLLSCVILLTVTAGMVQSKYVHLPNSQWQVSQYKEVATWDEAKKHCESEGATLASPVSKELLEYMKAIIAVNNHTTPYFIGFKARHNTEFRSEEGILLQDVPEAFDIVEQIDPREGDCLCMDGHSIRVEPCWSRLPFICYTNGTTDATTTEEPTTTTEDDTPSCDPGYIISRTSVGSSYKIHEKKVTWEEANNTCTAEGASLAIPAVDDYEERQFVKNAVFSISHPSWSLVWIGFRHWSNVNGKQVFAIRCTALTDEGTLSYRSCNDHLHFICFKDSSC